jgi:hypothetical protein
MPARPCFLASAAAAAAAANGFSEAGVDGGEVAAGAFDDDLRTLVALYAAAVSAGRAAMAAYGDAMDLITAKRVAADAFVAAADRLGLPPFEGSIQVDLFSVTAANVPPASYSAAHASLTTCRVFLTGIVGPSGNPLGGIVYADTFLPGPQGPLVLTSAVPLVLMWPGEGAETEACDGTRDAVQKLLRELSRGGKTSESTAEEGDEDADEARLAGTDAEAGAGADGGEEEVEPLAPLSERYTLQPSLALGPAVLVATPEPVLMFPLAAAGLAEEVSGGGGGFHGEWYVFENGVSFAPNHAPVVPLVLGANVTAVSVHDGIESSTSASAFGETVDATEAVVVFQLAEGAAAAVPPMHLCGGVGSGGGGGGGGGRVLCFSLAPMGLKARRHFLREVIPQWKAAAKEAGITCDGGDTSNVLATSSTALMSKAILRLDDRFIGAQGKNVVIQCGDLI